MKRGDAGFVYDLLRSLKCVGNHCKQFHYVCYSNDSFEGEPEEKRRKTTNVVIEQPATDSKVLIDNVPDNSSLFEEVRDTLFTSRCTRSVFRLSNI